MQDFVRTQLIEGARLFETAAESLPASVEQAAQILTRSVSSGGKILFFGNGGSAADAQHAAAELVCRFRHFRDALPALALTTDVSVLTSISNDFGFHEVFSRQVEALLKPGDAVVAISTSGESDNVVQGAAAAMERGGSVVAITNQYNSRLAKHAHVTIAVPAVDTPRVQELHIAVLHIMCDLVERSVMQQAGTGQ